MKIKEWIAQKQNTVDIRCRQAPIIVKIGLLNDVKQQSVSMDASFKVGN
jgi:hypothetical protein